ncbi:MAG: hypothetical protein IKH25_09115 [Muribaculaceae bacterium]|nr:hypothetical protein [Muribaculaceae bacterium]
MPRPPRATCPVGGGSAAVKPPAPAGKRQAQHRRPPRDQVPRAVALPRPPRATCPVGGGFAAVKNPAPPSSHF